MSEIDIDKLLADDEPEEETKDLKQEEPSTEQKSAAEKTDETESEKVKALKKVIRDRQKEIADLKASKETKKEEVVDAADPLATREGWLKQIKDTANETIKPILDANQKRAIKTFIERHPEYATGENKSKLKECVAAAQGQVEEGDILISMSRAWASQNYQELERAAARREQGRTNAQKSALKAASTGESVQNEDDFTEEESDKAAKLGMSAAEYRRAHAQYRANSVNSI